MVTLHAGVFLACLCVALRQPRTGGSSDVLWCREVVDSVPQLRHFSSRISHAFPSSHSALAFDFDSFVSAAISFQFISK